MGIKYLNGQRLRRVFLAGAAAVASDRDYLNKINVYPVPDGDTGTNLSLTLQSIAAALPDTCSVGELLTVASEAALQSSRGNSGIIFTQFLFGLREELVDKSRVGVREFSTAATKAVDYTYHSLSEPVEGTILSVMRSWASVLAELSTRNDDFIIVLKKAQSVAENALRKTPEQLPVLAQAGVVDAGAKGFVDFLAGMVGFIAEGNVRAVPEVTNFVNTSSEIHDISGLDKIKYRYCTEAVIHDAQFDAIKLKNILKQYGDSVVVAGSPRQMHFHVHTSNPADLFDELRGQCQLTRIKADDMQRQFELNSNARYPIALVTDSACDLPEEIMEKHQIVVIPFTLSFGNNYYLDKITLLPDKFYQLLQSDLPHPTTAIPGQALVESWYSFLDDKFDQVLSLHISGQLSGMYKLARQLAGKFEGKIKVFDTRQLSGSEGLVVLRVAEAIDAGMSAEEIASNIYKWSGQTKIYVDVATLKYMVRGGRVSPVKGLAARLLNLKPIVSLDSEGKGVIFDKSNSRRRSMKKILGHCRKLAQGAKIRYYSINHAASDERARNYASQLEEIFGKPPLYIEDVSPVVGAHNGIGVVAVSVMTE